MYSEVGNTIVMEKTFFEKIIGMVSREASEKAIEVFKIEQMKDTELSTSEAAEYLGITPPTILKYTDEGHRKAGKLSYKTKGVKRLFNKYDLKVFKENM